MGQSNQKSIGFFEKVKIESMTNSELEAALKAKIDEKKDFDNILNNFKLYNDNINIKRFPASNLKQILIKFKTTENYDILRETKKEYVNIFHKYYSSHYSKYGLYYDKFKAANDYDSLVREQKNYLIYKKYIKNLKKRKIQKNFL